MRALGTLIHETKSGNLVIREQEGAPHKIPSMYSPAGTKKIRVGKIQDIIGPKSRPYIIVKPQARLSKGELSSLKGETFYETPRRNHAAKKRIYVGKKSRVHR